MKRFYSAFWIKCIIFSNKLLLKRLRFAIMSIPFLYGHVAAAAAVYRQLYYERDAVTDVRDIE